MKVQSLSLVVPGNHCVNACEFCVSRMHENPYPDTISQIGPSFHNNVVEYVKRLDYARDNGCNTLLITGRIDPQQNKEFLVRLGFMLQMMKNPFRAIEIQTTGVFLDKDYLEFLKTHVGVSLLSLSISSFDSRINGRICNMPVNNRVGIFPLCMLVKETGMTLRLSVNLNDYFTRYTPEEFFNICHGHLADQVTLRVLYADGDSKQAEWVRANAMPDSKVTELKNYVIDNGEFLGKLSHGACKYSIKSMSTVIDSDCMDKGDYSPEDYKYLVLQENGHLYTRWDNPASLIY